MRFNRLDYVVWGLVGILLLALGIVIWRGDQVGVTLLRTTPVGEAAGRAPIVVEFDQRMDPDSVEANFAIDPAMEGTFIWRDNTLYFVPGAPWEPGVVYYVSLKEGVQSQQGHALLAEVDWSFQSRPAGLAFLRDQGSGYELWILSALDEGKEVQLTHTDGALYDFAVSPDGERLVYSALNEMNGIDLWAVDRNGGEPSLLLDCGPDRCSAPAWSIDGRIAFSRATAPLGPAEPYGAPRIWVLDVQTGAAARLYADTQRIGYGPSWSPDARKLAFYDGVQAQIVVLEMLTGGEVYLPSQAGVVGTWTPDGSQMLYYDTRPVDENAVNLVFRSNFDTQDILPFFDPQPSDGSYSNPVVSPDGEWVALRVRPFDAGPGDQVWVTPQDGRYALSVADQPDYLFSNVTWDPWSQRLAFYRIQLGVGNPSSEVWVWERETAELHLAVENASAPAWLP